MKYKYIIALLLAFAAALLSSCTHASGVSSIPGWYKTATPGEPEAAFGVFTTYNPPAAEVTPEK